MPLTDEQRATLLQEDEALTAAGITDAEIIAAINGYLEGAMFTAVDDEGNALDALGPVWSPDAQWQARHEVTMFVTEHVADVRAFLASTGHDWTQVGIDLSFSRNGHGAGFWSRDNVGPEGQRLTDAARAAGERHVYVTEHGEADFE